MSGKPQELSNSPQLLWEGNTWPLAHQPCCQTSYSCDSRMSQHSPFSWVSCGAGSFLCGSYWVLFPGAYPSGTELFWGFLWGEEQVLLLLPALQERGPFLEELPQLPQEHSHFLVCLQQLLLPPSQGKQLLLPHTMGTAGSHQGHLIGGGRL